MTTSYPLYALNDPATHAFRIKPGQLVFEFSDLGEQVVEAEAMLVGSIEHFLRPRSKDKGKRLFSLSYKGKSAPERVPFSEIDENMLDFEFGFLANQFLALTLQHVNDAHNEAALNLPPPMAAYEARARIFTRLLNNLYLIGKKKPEPDLIEYASEQMKKAIYSDGAKLIREQRLANIELPPARLEDFVQEFPKGSVLCKEGDPANCMYVLLSGKIGVVTGGRYVAYIKKPGEAFGEASLFLGATRTASLYIEEDSAIYAIEDRDLETFYRDHQFMFQAIARTLAPRIADTLDTLTHFCRSLQIKESSAAFARWEKMNQAAEGLLGRVYKEIDEISEEKNIPEIKDLWTKFVGEH